MPGGQPQASPGSARVRARRSTSSSICSVSRPVKVFCWLGWKRTEQHPSAHRDLGTVAEPRTRPRQLGPGPARERRARPSRRTRRAPATTRVPGSEPQLGVQPRGTGVALGRRRLVGRRRAPDRRSDPDAVQLQSVVGRRRRRLVGQTRPVQGGVEPVAAAVTGEHPAGAVGTVRRRRQPDDEDRGQSGRRTRAPADPSSRRPRTSVASRGPPSRATRPAEGRLGTR